MEQNQNSDSLSRRGGSAAAVLLIFYLLLTAPLIPAGGLDAARLAIFALQLGTAAALALVRGGHSPATRALASWAPLLLVLPLYAELPLLMDGMRGAVRYHDPAIALIERAMFGTQPAFTWAGAWPWPALSEILHACYFSYYPLIFVPPAILYLGLAGPRDAPARSAAFDETVLALVISFLACFVVFVVMPVQGPRYLGAPAGVPDGPVRRLVLAVLQGASSRGAAFPSSHVAVAVTQALMALRHQPRVGRVILPLTVGLAAGAVYGGFHYGVDVLTGAAVGTLAVLAVAPLQKRLKGWFPGFTSTPATA